MQTFRLAEHGVSAHEIAFFVESGEYGNARVTSPSWKHLPTPLSLQLVILPRNRANGPQPASMHPLSRHLRVTSSSTSVRDIDAWRRGERGYSQQPLQADYHVPLVPSANEGQLGLCTNPAHQLMNHFATHVFRANRFASAVSARFCTI